MDMMTPLGLPVIDLVIGALLVVNIWTVVRFGQDKRYAEQGARRVSESDLLGLAVIGGTPGAYLARQVFRHKTRKQPFSFYLHLIAVLQAGAIIGWFIGVPG